VKNIVEHLMLKQFEDQLKPVSASYARYAPDATFHDPIGIANGLESVKAQFNGKLFRHYIACENPYRCKR
jgi:hypothetical protein